MKTIDVCLSPNLLPLYAEKNMNMVMIDAIRASATICTAMYYGIEKIIPISDLATALSYKEKGFLIAGERNALKVENFDYGNSPLSFIDNNLKNKSLAITTTNGTQVLNRMKGFEPKNIFVGSFVNIDVLCTKLFHENENILLVCSGWKNKINTEDSLFAGCLVEKLLERNAVEVYSEAAFIALNLWKLAKTDLYNFILQNSARLKSKISFLEHDVKYCLTENIAPVVPVLRNIFLINDFSIK